MSSYQTEEERQQANNSGFLVLFLLPFILIMAFFSAAAWQCAKGGIKYTAVKVLALPASFFFANLIGAMFFIAGSLLIGLFGGPREITNYAFANWADLSLGVLWQPIFFEFVSMVTGRGDHSYTVMPTIPIKHIIFYQLVLHVLIGRRIIRQWTLAIYDSAVQVACRKTGTEPALTRQALLEHDAGYSKDAGYYSQRGKPALAALIAVLLSGGNPNTYYV